MKTRLVPTALAGLLIVEIDLIVDERGFFLETWHRRDFAAAGLDADFVQDNHSRSGPRVIRGLHYQDVTMPVAKLVRCTLGRILDVAVDLRASSPTFGRWCAVELSAENHRQVFVPVGFAHGFATLTDAAEIQYKQTGYYASQADRCLAWNDPDLAIRWPFDDPVLSDRDRRGSSFREYRAQPVFE